MTQFATFERTYPGGSSAYSLEIRNQDGDFSVLVGGLELKLHSLWQDGEFHLLSSEEGFKGCDGMHIVKCTAQDKVFLVTSIFFDRASHVCVDAKGILRVLFINKRDVESAWVHTHSEDFPRCVYVGRPKLIWSKFDSFIGDFVKAKEPFSIIKKDELGMYHVVPRLVQLSKKIDGQRTYVLKLIEQSEESEAS